MAGVGEGVGEEAVAEKEAAAEKTKSGERFLKLHARGGRHRRFLAEAVCGINNGIPCCAGSAYVNVRRGGRAAVSTTSPEFVCDYCLRTEDYWAEGWRKPSCARCGRETDYHVSFCAECATEGRLRFWCHICVGDQERGSAAETDEQ